MLGVYTAKTLIDEIESLHNGSFEEDFDAFLIRRTIFSRYWIARNILLTKQYIKRLSKEYSGTRPIDLVAQGDIEHLKQYLADLCKLKDDHDSFISLNLPLEKPNKPFLITAIIMGVLDELVSPTTFKQLVTEIDSTGVKISREDISKYLRREILHRRVVQNPNNVGFLYVDDMTFQVKY